MISGFLLLVALIAGPWLGIAVDRLIDRTPPTMEHRCCHCAQGLGLSSLMPVYHWRQRCGHCHSRQTARYWSVDGLLSVVFVALGLRFGWSLQLVPYMALAGVLVVLSVVDIETHLLPNIVVWPSIVTGIAITLGLSPFIDESRWAPAIIGGLVYGGFIGLAHIVYPPGMGRGDVKLALLLGIFIGWVAAEWIDAIRLVMYAMIVASLGGAIGGVLYNLATRRGREEIPFGPALAASALLVIVSSGAILG